MKYARRVVIVYWVALTVGILFPYGSNITRATEPAIGDRPDLAHFLALMALGVGVLGTGVLPQCWSLAAKVWVLFSYAVVTELAQMIVPGRNAGWIDGTANVLGVAAGVTLWWVVGRYVVGKGWKHDVRLCSVKGKGSEGERDHGWRG